MAAEWPQVRVGDLVAAKALAVNDGYRVRNEELGPVGTPFVRGGDIGDGWINTCVDDHIRPEYAERVTQKLSRPGDAAFITKGTVGRVGYLHDGQPPVVFAPQVAYWRSLDLDRLDSRWIFYLLCGPEFQANLDAVKTHGAMAADYVSISQQLDFRLTVPPIREQRAIASVLGALDDKIDLNRRMNETLEATARALFKSWFVDFDPVRAKAEGRKPFGMDAETAALFPDGFQESDAGAEVPRGWRLGPVTELQAAKKYACVAGPFGSNLTSKDYVDAGVPVLRGSNMSGGGTWLNDDGFAYVSEAKADELASNMAFAGDVVFTQRGTLGQVVVVPKDTAYSRFVISQSQMKLTVDGTVGSAFYVALYFAQDKIVDYIIANGQHAGVPHINLGFLRTFRILLPPPQVLLAFDRLVGPMLDGVRGRTIESRRLVELRDYLLPKLLSGEVRVRDAEKLLGDAA